MYGPVSNKFRDCVRHNERVKIENCILIINIEMSILI